jgi:hypothetical protein
MLYAIGIGMGADPLDRDELPFVFEHRAAEDRALDGDGG